MKSALQRPVTDDPVPLSSVLEADLLRLAAQLDKCGYAIVPRKPTRRMVMAGMVSRGAPNAYRSMLDAAPKVV